MLGYRRTSGVGRACAYACLASGCASLRASINKRHTGNPGRGRRPAIVQMQGSFHYRPHTSIPFARSSAADSEVRILPTHLSSSFPTRQPPSCDSATGTWNGTRGDLLLLLVFCRSRYTGACVMHSISLVGVALHATPPQFHSPLLCLPATSAVETTASGQERYKISLFFLPSPFPTTTPQQSSRNTLRQ